MNAHDTHKRIVQKAKSHGFADQRVPEFAKQQRLRALLVELSSGCQPERRCQVDRSCLQQYIHERCAQLDHTCSRLCRQS